MIGLSAGLVAWLTHRVGSFWGMHASSNNLKGNCMLGRYAMHIISRTFFRCESPTRSCDFVWSPSKTVYWVHQCSKVPQRESKLGLDRSLCGPTSQRSQIEKRNIFRVKQRLADVSIAVHGRILYGNARYCYISVDIGRKAWSSRRQETWFPMLGRYAMHINHTFFRCESHYP